MKTVSFLDGMRIITVTISDDGTVYLTDNLGTVFTLAK